MTGLLNNPMVLAMASMIIGAFISMALMSILSISREADRDRLEKMLTQENRDLGMKINTLERTANNQRNTIESLLSKNGLLVHQRNEARESAESYKEENKTLIDELAKISGAVTITEDRINKKA